MIIAFGLAGLLLGGLANILADDLPHRRWPRAPHCPDCEQSRPVVAWLGVTAFLLRQRWCPDCPQPLPWRHPLLELFLAIAFVYLSLRYGLSSEGAFIALYVWVAALVTVTDLEHRLILNVIMAPAILLALVESALTSRLGFLQALRGGAIGFAVVFGVFLLGEAFRRLVARLRGESVDEVAFGFGDVTLSTFAGLVVGDGPGGIGLVLVIMILVGGLTALAYLLYRRFISRDYSAFSAIPYGPNIIVGMLVVLIWRDDIGEFLRAAIFGS